VKVEPIVYEGRKVYTVPAFSRGIATWLGRLPDVWVEGEVTELRRSPAWQRVFLTLKDPESGATLGVTMRRDRFDALELELLDGERVHVHGRAELYEARGELSFKALTIERFGIGAYLAALERLKKKLGAEGLFAAERKRPLPFLPRRIGLVTSTDAAAKQDVLTTITTRFPPARIVVAETPVQGPRAAAGIVEALFRVATLPEVDVIVLTRGGGSFEDLLPFSDEAVVRAVASCPVPVISAVGHEQDTPLCDLAADVRASTPTAAGKLVVPDLAEVLQRLERARAGVERGARRTLETREQRLVRAYDRLRRAPALAVERKHARLEATAGRLRALSPRATLGRGYAIVRARNTILRSAAEVAQGERIEVELADGGFGAVVE
jgi:exodeoxyribonuclease VII large subunit